MEGFKRMTDMHVKVRKALLNRVAKEIAEYLQTRFIDEQEMSPEEQAYWESETDRLNEIAIKKQGEPLFSHDKVSLPLRLESYTIKRAKDQYFLTFHIADPDKPVARFQQLFGGEKTTLQKTK